MKSQNSKQSQKEKVLTYLTKYKKGLTQMEAAAKWNIWRLGALIHILRGEGHSIRTEKVKNKNHGTHARYFLND